ncbi:MAG: hypothetical protein OEZ01_08990 [Candidatus Heimdallarchaeota archaeon]|nr:hypothetical protein [Candidatus Heimdallarchaeota archaeon]MDH5646130.1 hypothetical protein [Candidatus Heimdallarchaeota archaeon]
MVFVNKFESNNISSIFTRKKGYTKIKSSLSYSNERAVKILNTFTPQGVSPKICLRIGSIDNQIGVGYYYMEDNSTVRISTFLSPIQINNLEVFTPPIEEDQIIRLAKGELSMISHKYSFFTNTFLDIFDNEDASSILYSILSGDNLIIVHPNHTDRLQFMASLLNVLPKIIFQYSRLTSSCSELEGNENIIGVEELPKKYRSHKKLFLSLDTIFIDLTTRSIEGEGIKNCNLTRDVISKIKENYSNGIIDLQNIIEDIINNNSAFIEKLDAQSGYLVNTIQEKLNITNESEQSWIMSF